MAHQMGVAAREVPQRFAVAFSLAGEQREIVLPIAQEVEAVLGRSAVFYDEWYEHWIAGEDADLLLQQLYGERSELVVVCISGAYGEKAWTHVEHRALRARTMTEQRASRAGGVLPLRVGDGDVSGVLVNEIVPDVRGRTPAASTELIIARLNLVRGSALAHVPASGWPAEPPVVQWPMADHTDARAAFGSLLSESSPSRVLLITGTSETGKSHMTRQMTRNCLALPGVSCGRFDFKGTADMTVEVEAMCQLLEIETPVGNGLNERLGKMLVELRRRARPTVLILDSYEDAGEARAWVENVLLPHAMSARWLRVVVLGQTVPRRSGSTWESVAATPLTLQVPGPEHWLEYGQAHHSADRLDLAFVTRAHEFAGGKAGVLAGLLGPRS